MCDIFTQPQSWVEGSAIQQLKAAEKLDGMKKVVGLPDIHPGKGHPIGASFLSNNIHPTLVGSDIGCGMSVSKINTPLQKIKINKWYKKLKKVEKMDIDNSIFEGTNIAGLDLTKLGTVGSGNHFIEIQKINEVYNENSDFKKNDVILVVHSGSRGYGTFVFNKFQKDFGYNPLTDPVIQQDYLEKHDKAILWAYLNRQALTHKTEQALGVKTTLLLDICHNYVEKTPEGHFLHRKGAASTYEKSLLIVPGSRDSYSYLFKGLHNNALNSIAHGAGRKWKRSECKGKLKNFTADRFKKTSFGGFVICEDKKLLFEEAPQSYKEINQVIDDIEHFKLGQKIAQSIPILTYKTA